MVDISKQYWFENVPFEREHQERIGNVLDIKQYFLRKMGLVLTKAVYS